MPFQLSHRSLVNLQGVRLELKYLVSAALQTSTVDFTVIDGLRTAGEEAQNVANGKSQTMKSRHLTGHAIDFIAIVDGKGTWDEPPFVTVAEGFRQAAIKLGIAIVWGGCWDHRLDLEPSAEAALNGYVARRKQAGKSAFTDLGHIQLDWAVFP